MVARKNEPDFARLEGAESFPLQFKSLEGQLLALLMLESPIFSAHLVEVWTNVGIRDVRHERGKCS